MHTKNKNGLSKKDQPHFIKAQVKFGLKIKIFREERRT